MTLLELAERCEKATGPDRELDRDVHDALGLTPNRHGFESHAYTASLDAAMTLVPEGMRDELEITTLYQVARVGINLNHGPDGSPFYASNESNSIPLALCAAALRARGETL